MGSDYRVLQQAAEWFALLQSGSVSASERRAWAAWLEQPEHAQAWAKVERISGQFQPLTNDKGQITALRFVFPPYQVGPYSDGTQTADVPAAVLLPHVAAGYRELFAHP